MYLFFMVMDFPLKILIKIQWLKQYREILKPIHTFSV